MNPLTNRIATLAASALVFGTMAFGQTPALKVQIPFDFHSSAGSLPAGSYTIKTLGNGALSNITAFRNEASKQTVFVSRLSQEYKAENLGAASVIFRCGAGVCSLSGIRLPDGTTSYYPNHQSKRDKEVTVIATSVHGVKAD